MARSDLNARLRRSGMQKYLLDGERPVIADHQHWALVAPPVAASVAGLVLVVALDTSLPASSGGLVQLLWYGLLGLFVWSAWKVLLWRRNWFVATDKRMLLNHGLINVDVAMLSLSKVVDLTYTRSTMGRVLGYGTFVRESAGQSQTLREIEWVKKPEKNYNLLCAAIFGLHDYSNGLDSGDQGPGDGPTAHPPSLYSRFLRREDRSLPASYQRGPIVMEQPSGIHTRPAEQRDESDSWHPHSTAGDSGVRDADTGPIPN